MQPWLDEDEENISAVEKIKRPTVMSFEMLIRFIKTFTLQNEHRL